MKKVLLTILAVMFFIGMTQTSLQAGEHGGKEHGGSAKAPAAVKVVTPPTKDDIRSAMKNFVITASAVTGTFDLVDPDNGETVNLEMQRVHERVGKTGDYYYSCADFTDKNTGIMYDLDLDVADLGNGNLKVVDVRLHKEDSVPRYTYDQNDNRIPLKEGTKSHLGAIVTKGSPKGGQLKTAGAPSAEHAGEDHAQEHGGQEHGGK